MIYVTVGLHEQGFDRLVAAMDEIASRINEEMVIQRGSSSYVPRHARFADYYPREEAEEFFQKARVVVCHAGIGSIIQALNYEKPFIVVPRLKRFHEHNSDHQREVAEEVKKRYGIAVVYDMGGLSHALKNAKSIRHSGDRKKALIETIRSFINKGMYVEGG